MGTCLSKKTGSSSAVAVVSQLAVPDPKSSHTTAVSAAVATSVPKLTHLQVENELQLKKNKTIQPKKQESRPEKEIRSESPVKKEIFLIRHRKSHEGRDKDSSKHSNHQEQQQEQEENKNVPTAPQDEERLTSGVPAAEAISTVGVRTSSCTKEEVDAILIQCGRLSRSSSGKATNASSDRGKKYSGSKRSYDFDHCDKQAIVVDDDDLGDLDKRNTNSIENDDDEAAGESRGRRHRQRQRQSSSSSRRSPSNDRRTPSRERDQQNNQRGERRVSRSPRRRASDNSASANANNNAGGGSRRPAKMVSVPATVSSLAMDKSNNGGDLPTVTAVKRISVKRNVGSEANTRVASSPRSQSPARMNTSTKVCDENQQQQPSLSRSSSRKAEHSPYRRNALTEIDTNSLTHTQPNNNSNRVSNRNKKDIEGEIIVKESSNALNQKPKVEMNNNRVVAQGTNNSKTTITKTTIDKVVTMNCTTTVHQQQKTMEEPKGKSPATTMTQLVVVTSEAESQKPPQTLTRSRSARLSREFDFKPETLVQPTPSYTALLLEDIQNFHQKTNTNTGSISLPACVTKACSIVEEIADLNSTTSSNISCAFSEDRRSPPSYQSSWNKVGKIISDARGRDPLVETEVEVEDDVMEPSFHKYVTVRRGGGLAVGGGDMEDQESSGSNSFVGGSSSQQNPGFSTSWEPNSADSGDCWTSRSNTREENVSGLGLKPRHGRME